MDDYLTKPVLPGDIQRLLQAFFKEHATTRPIPASAKSTSQPEHTAKTGLPGFISQPLYQTMFGADPALFNRCMRSFLASSTEMTADIERCLQLNDPRETKAIAHKIKGAAANIANTELVSVAERVEKAAESDQSIPGPEALLTTLQEHVQLLSEMAWTTEPPALADNIRREPINHTITRMAQRLGNNRIASDSDIDRVLEFLRENNETILASRLSRALETYKFKEATDLLSKIEPESQDS